MTHQIRGVEFGVPRDLIVYVMDRGTGKTPTAMRTLSEKMKRGVVRRILYVAPLSTLENVARESRRFTDNLRPQIVYGARSKRARMIREPGNRNLDIINFDALRIMLVELMEAKYDAMVLDECFAAGTPVDTPRGPVAIEDVKPGDEVFSAAGRDVVVSTAKRRKSRLVRLTLEDGRVIVSSENHPFFTPVGWVQSCLLREADNLYARDYRVSARVARVEILESGDPEFRRISGGEDTIDLYDLEVSGHPSFGVHGVLVHNSTRIKERSTRMCQVATVLGSAARTKILMTGMPFTEGVENAWSQFHFLDPEIVGDNYYSFRNRYCVLATRHVRQKGKLRKYHEIVGYKKLDDLQDRIAPHTYRVAKEDCLDLPEKTYQTLAAPMLEAQAKQYAVVESRAMSEIGDHQIAHAVALSKLQKLRQVAAGFLYDRDHEPVTIPCSKYAELETLLGELYGSQKAVVFTSFRAEPEMVRSTAESMKRKIEVFQIPDNPMDRQSTIDEWTAWKASPAILVGNARSGGVGLNLTAAHVAIFLSNDWRMEDRAQAEDRVHRIGSEVHNKITIVDIVTQGTIEEDVLAALKSKRDLVEVFLERMRLRSKGGGA